jgi:hypothetical protein
MNLYLRPSCAYCPSKSGKSGSDVTLADFWGISSCYPSLYNKDGVSLVIAASKRGDEIIQSLQHVKRVQVDYSKAIEFNTPYEHSVSIPPVSAVFWKYFSTDGIYAVRKTIKASNPSLLKRIVCRLRLHIRF